MTGGAFDHTDGGTHGGQKGSSSCCVECIAGGRTVAAQLTPQREGHGEDAARGEERCGVGRVGLIAVAGGVLATFEVDSKGLA